MFLNPAPEQKDYLLVLRGFAAIGVILSHCFTVGHLSIGAVITHSTANFVLFRDPIGWRDNVLFIIVPLLGSNFVTLFFVQSGYLMGKLFHDGRYDLSLSGLRRFYTNRYMR